MNQIVFRSITMQTQTRVEAETGSSGMSADIDGWTEAYSHRQTPWSLLNLRQHLDQTGFRSVRSAEIKITKLKNWRNLKIWDSSTPPASVASDITTNESCLIKGRPPLQDFPAAPRNSQPFLFTWPSLLISWNKTRASRSRVGAGERGRVAIYGYCEITLGGHPPPQR